MYSGLYTPRTRQYILNNFTPVGLHVLVVDDDPLCLMVLDRMLRQCNYKVTTSNRVNHALELLREEDKDFDIVISDVYMPDEDGFKLLEVIGLELDLPVIMISANGDFSVVMKGIIHGACDYLIKPVRIEELQNIWQHVIRRKSKDFLKSDLQGENDVDAQASESQEELYKKRKEVLEISDICADDISSSSPKKARVNWSVQLHQQFMTAVNHLGVDKAVPKKILEIMNVQGLSRENVASHLQKYRLYLKRLSGVISEPLPVASFQALDNGAPGGSMLIRAGRMSSDPVGSVKGLNLGAGLKSKTGKTQKVDSGTMKSLSQLKSFQQKQAANRAQVLSAIGVGEPSCTASSRGGLFRMASLDVSFLLQAASQAKEEAFSAGVPSVKVVDDLATRSISRSVKLEDDVVFTGASPSFYDVRRQTTREGLNVHSSFIARGEEQSSRIGSAKTKLDHCGVSSVEVEKLSCGSAAPVYLQGISEEPMQSNMNQVSTADYGFAYGMHSTPYMEALQADLPESSKSELNKPDYGRDKLQPIEKATREVAESMDLATDDTNNSTKQSYEVSTGSMATEMSGETFSDCSFEALINELEIIPHTQQHCVQQTNSELLDVDEYLQLD